MPSQLRYELSVGRSWMMLKKAMLRVLVAGILLDWRGDIEGRVFWTIMSLFSLQFDSLSFWQSIRTRNEQTPQVVMGTTSSSDTATEYVPAAVGYPRVARRCSGLL